jgi:hypothetical protein
LTFLKFSLKCKKENPCREAASNALKMDQIKPDYNYNFKSPLKQHFQT